MTIYQYVLIVAKRVMISKTYVTNARRQPIATPHAKRNIDTNTKTIVRNM